MPFTGYPFLLFFLPAGLGGFAAFRKLGADQLSIWWLLLISIVFCAWSNATDLIVLAVSMGVSFCAGRVLHSTVEAGRRRMLLVAGLLFDGGLLLSFKVMGRLPLGISFYTFVQAYYLIDIYRKDAVPAGVADYLLAVTFFPKFVAGPIVRPADFLGQRRPIAQEAIASGAAMFAMGLVKKLLADHCAQWAGAVFSAAEHPLPAIGMCDAWIGVLAYTFQIYFDFSGYTDMAIGLGAFLGWRLPPNFNSPYKARNMIDFWRRWHMTLTAFLTENIYFRLPGQRKGAARRHLNLMITMVICGLWHGASWTFAIWGAYHGACLVVNHASRKTQASRHSTVVATALTFACVTVGWALFGARSLRGAWRLIGRMFGLAGAPLTPQLFDSASVAAAALYLGALAALACAGPNTQEILARHKVSINAAAGAVRSLHPAWIYPGLATLWVIGVLLLLSRGSGGGSPFIYAIF